MNVQAVIILVLIASPCLTGIIKTSDQDDNSDLIKATLDLVTSCYGNQSNVVGLAGNSHGSLIKTLQSSISIAVTLLDSTRRVMSHDHIPKKCRSKLQLFVITVSSPTEVEEILIVLKNSIWWNHMASILILHWPPESGNGCSKGFEVLSAAWKMNLLNTKLICLDITKKMLIYTYNPYINMAPDSWEVENTYRGENDHPWTLFVRKYRQDMKTCEDLDFDKTTNLGGYGIRCSVKNIYHQIPSDTNSCESKQNREIGLTDIVVPKIIFCALNGTLEVLTYNFTETFNFMDASGRDILLDTVDGTSDIFLNVRYTIGKDVKVTYPRVYAGLCVSTQYRGELSPLEKIESVVDRSSRYGILLVIVITVLFFILVLRQGTGEAILNIVRIICNGSVPGDLTGLALRFYMGCLFIFVVTIQALYQGQMATLLTKPVLLDNINSMQDLIDANHKIYTYKTLTGPFRSPDFEGRLFVLNKIDCINQTRYDSSAACIIDCAVAIKKTPKLKLYLSTEPIVKATMSYVIREDWPLESRVNKILSTLFEANIIWYWRGKEFDDNMEIQKFYKEEEEAQQFRAISLDDLSFAFVILGIGLSCATICFLVETGINGVLSKMTNTRSYFRNLLLQKSGQLTRKLQ